MLAHRLPAAGRDGGLNHEFHGFLEFKWIIIQIGFWWMEIRQWILY